MSQCHVPGILLRHHMAQCHVPGILLRPSSEASIKGGTLVPGYTYTEVTKAALGIDTAIYSMLPIIKWSK